METANQTNKKPSVHKILAHSYATYFLFVLVGVSLDLIFSLKFFGTPALVSLGVLFLIAGTFLIVWAQKTSRSLKKEIISKETFIHGPYRYTRSPTHWGLFLLVFGFGVVSNAFFVVLSSVIAFIVTKLIFLNKEEEILSDKYGEPYLDYKKSVRI
ncbi:MAG: methyltransferase [Candidatus Paceibacterota bacterium]